MSQKGKVKMEIEVGEYGRTNLGTIIKFAYLEYNPGQIDTSKVFLIKNNRISNDFYYLEKDEYIVKHSKNIIDLIEVGDYVNGIEIDLLEKSENRVWSTSTYGDEDIVFYENEIKTILTKEQYQANCYTVERKEE